MRTASVARTPILLLLLAGCRLDGADAGLGLLAGVLAVALVVVSWRLWRVRVDAASARLESLRTARTLDEREQELRQLRQDLEAARERLRALSTTDSLTGMHNRTYFDQHLPREWKRASRGGRNLAIVRVRIDQLEEMRETHGREAADACIKAVAGALGRVTKRAEDFVVRFSAEEFAVVLPRAEVEGARLLAERIQGRVAALEFVHDGRWLPVTVAIGIAAGRPGAGARPSDLIDAAGVAAARAVSEGTGRIVVSEGSPGGEEVAR